MLVDIHDNDAGIGAGIAERAVTEACVECVQLLALYKLKDGRGALADKREHIDEDCEDGYAHADGEGNPALPPGAPNRKEAGDRLTGHFSDAGSMPALSRLKKAVAAPGPVKERA